MPRGQYIIRRSSFAIILADAPAGRLGQIVGAGYHRALYFCMLTSLAVSLRDPLHRIMHDAFRDTLNAAFVQNVVVHWKCSLLQPGIVVSDRFPAILRRPRAASLAPDIII